MSRQLAPETQGQRQSKSDGEASLGISGEGRGSRRRGGGRSLGPLPHPARTLAHDPVQGTLAVRDGLFDSFGEQLRPGKYKWGYH